MTIDAQRSTSAVCERCGASFTPGRKTEGRFCSRSCYRLWWGATRQKDASRKGTERLAQLREQGQDPRKTEQAKWKRYMAYRSTALSTTPESDDDDDELWSQRGAYWEAAAHSGGSSYPWKRERRPLTLAGHGIALRVDAGTLFVRDGLTHHPQTRRERRFFPGDSRLPSRVVIVDGNGYVTLDVLDWLSRQEVPLVQLSWNGRVRSFLGTGSASLDPELVIAQVRALSDGTGQAYATLLIHEKVAGSLRTLAGLPSSPAADDAMSRLENILSELTAPIRDIDHLRLVEARAAYIYFAAWRGHNLRWHDLKRKPIPPEWRVMPIRQSLFSMNRHATHPVNALLNYAYAVVESQVHRGIVTIGLEPSIGYLHANRRGRAALVYDLMETLRPVVDAEILRFVRSHTFSAGDVHLTQRGVCRLHPQLARVAAAVGVDDSTVRELMLETVARIMDRSGPATGE